jgi:hypothetical protein
MTVSFPPLVYWTKYSNVIVCDHASPAADIVKWLLMVEEFLFSTLGTLNLAPAQVRPTDIPLLSMAEYDQHGMITPEYFLHGISRREDGVWEHFSFAHDLLSFLDGFWLTRSGFPLPGLPGGVENMDAITQGRNANAVPHAMRVFDQETQ